MPNMPVYSTVWGREATGRGCPLGVLFRKQEATARRSRTESVFMI